MDLTQYAGMIDRGGYFMITWEWMSVIAIRDSTDEKLKELCGFYGGTINYYAKKNCYYLNLNGEVCAEFLRDALPHLTRKRASAEVMLEFDDYMANRASRKPFQRLTDDEFRERAEIKNKLLKVNGKPGYNIETLVMERQAGYQEKRRIRDMEIRLAREQRQTQRLQAKLDKENQKLAEKEERKQQRKEQRAAERKIRQAKVFSMLNEWTVMEVENKLKAVFKNGSLKHAEVVSGISEFFRIGLSKSKLLLQDAMKENMVIKSGKKRDPRSKYRYNYVRDFYPEEYKNREIKLE